MMKRVKRRKRYFQYQHQSSSFNTWNTEVNVKALEHRRTINKKTRSGDKKMAKVIKTAKKVHTVTVYSMSNI